MHHNINIIKPTRPENNVTNLLHCLADSFEESFTMFNADWLFPLNQFCRARHAQSSYSMVSFQRQTIPLSGYAGPKLFSVTESIDWWRSATACLKDTALLDVIIRLTVLFSRCFAKTSILSITFHLNGI